MQEEFQNNVKHYIKTHRSLHGIFGFRRESVARDLVASFGYDAYECLLEVERQEENKVLSDKRYGLFIGRAMPFTNGHDAIIQDILLDGRTPIFILGGKNKKDERHPLTFEERVKLIKRKYPFGCKFIGLEDKDNWDEWYDSVEEELNKITPNMNQFVLYAHNKEMDKKDFFYKGKQYMNESYTKMFEENGIHIKTMDEVTCKLGHTIHATDVRKSEVVARRNLDARIYRSLKDKHNWWS